MALPRLVPLLPPGVRYYILRGDVAVPLVPVDQIPACIKSLATPLSPGRCKIEGWQLVGETQQSARLLQVDPATKSEFLSSDYTARFRNDSGALSKKEYCSHWIRTNSCDFAQDGCKYKHEMPDLATLRRIGFDDYPSWWKKKTSSRGDVGVRPRWLPRNKDQGGQSSIQPPASRAFHPSTRPRSPGRSNVVKVSELWTAKENTPIKEKPSGPILDLIDIRDEEDQSNNKVLTSRAHQPLPRSRGPSYLRTPEKNRASTKEISMKKDVPADENTIAYIPNLIDFDDDQSVRQSSTTTPRASDVHSSALPARLNHDLSQPPATAPDMSAFGPEEKQMRTKKQTVTPRMLGESRHAAAVIPPTGQREGDVGNRTSSPTSTQQSVASPSKTTGDFPRDRSPKSKKQSKSRSKGASSPPIPRTSYSKGRTELERGPP